MTPEERHDRFVKPTIAKAIQLGHLPKQKQISDIERLIQDAKSKIAKVRAHGMEIDKAVKAAGKDHDRAILWSELEGKYLDEMVQYNKDELLILLCHFLTQLTIKEIV